MKTKMIISFDLDDKNKDCFDALKTFLNKPSQGGFLEQSKGIRCPTNPNVRNCTFIYTVSSPGLTFFIRENFKNFALVNVNHHQNKITNLKIEEQTIMDNQNQNSAVWK